MKITNKSILIIQRRMTGYRVPFFEQLRQRLEDKDTYLAVSYGTPNEEDSLRNDNARLHWGIEIPSRYFYIGNFQLVWQKVSPILFKQQDLIIMPHENSLLMNYYLLLKRRFNRIKLAFWGHGGNFQSQSDSYREGIKSWTARQVDWWFAYTKMSVDKIIGNGFPEDKITCVNNAIDTSQLIEWSQSITSDELYALRTSLGLKGDTVGIFIGSLYKDKRLDFLFSAVDELRQSLPAFELIMIGDGPLRGDVKLNVDKRPWVHWVGAQHGREKVLHMSLGKVMLNPGLVGLGILDSFALGIPMVTTDCGIHSPEIAYLESGRNGIMVEDNVQAFTSAAERILKDDAFRQTLASACIEGSSRYTLEKMVDNFCEGIFKALSAEPKRTPPTRCQ